jgi:hypothetical protein
MQKAIQIETRNGRSGGSLSGLGSGRLLQALVVAYPYPWLSIIRRPPALMLSWAWTLLRSEQHFLAPSEPPTFWCPGSASSFNIESLCPIMPHDGTGFSGFTNGPWRAPLNMVVLPYLALPTACAHFDLIPFHPANLVLLLGVDNLPLVPVPQSRPWPFHAYFWRASNQTPTIVLSSYMGRALTLPHRS